jgi:imidazolonepropionase-like amidohydrolase
MPSMLRAALPAVLVLGALGLAGAQGASSTVAFVGITVIPMDRERVVPGQTVVVSEGRISAMGPAGEVRVPAGATRVEGAGRFLLPGLAEMHAHIPGGQASDAAVARVLYLFVANGVTTIRGMLGHPRHLALREETARGAILGPTIYTSGPSFSGTSVPDADTARRLVAAQKQAGYDFLKIHPGVKREVFEALATEADRLGIRFAGHVPIEVGLQRALEARYATIDHLDGYVEALLRPDAPLQASDTTWFGVNLADHVDARRIPELVAATRRAGTWIVPTETLLEHTTNDTDPAEMARWPEMRYVPPEQIAQWTEGKRKLAATPGVTVATRRRFIEVRRRLIKALHDGGVGLLLGSDAPQVWNVPGFSIHRELALLVEAGLTPWQALETGTRNVAAFLGTLDERGTIAPGKRADLVVLDADPLASIANTARIHGVMVGGRWMPRAEIDEGLKRYQVGQP